MGNSENSRARSAAGVTTTDSRRRSALVAVALAVAAVVVVGLAAGAWFLAAPPPDATRPAATASADGGTGAQPDAAAVDGSEVLPPEPNATTPQHLPPREPATARVTVPLPASASAVDAVVDGYPVDVAAPMPDTQVLETTVASEGGVMQFSLRARTGADAEEVLAHYGALWSGLGLAPVASGEAAQELSYTDSYSSVTVAAEAGGTGVVYTIYGVLRAA